MTLSGSASPSDRDDITRLAKAILEGESRPLEERRTQLPPRHVRPEALRSLRVPSIVLQLLLAGWVGFSVVAIAFGFMQRSLLHRLATNPGSVSFADAAADQHRVDAVNAIFIALLVVTGVVFLVWFWRAYRNLDALDLPRRYGTGWAIGGWFLPFFSFFRPKQVADDIWASVNAATLDDRREQRGSALLACWWAAWIGLSLMAVFAHQDAEHPTVDQLLTTNAAYLARDTVLIVASVLAALVVRCITSAQSSTLAGE